MSIPLRPWAGSRNCWPGPPPLISHGRSPTRYWRSCGGLTSSICSIRLLGLHAAGSPQARGPCHQEAQVATLMRRMGITAIYTDAADESDEAPSRDGCRVLLFKSETQGQPRDDVMGVVRGLEGFCGGGRSVILVLQFGGEVREAILCERPDPFRDHDRRSRIDFDTDGRIGGALSTRLNKRVFTGVGNEYRRSGGEVGLDASMDEFLISKEWETQA